MLHTVRGLPRRDATRRYGCPRVNRLSPAVAPRGGEGRNHIWLLPMLLPWISVGTLLFHPHLTPERNCTEGPREDPHSRTAVTVVPPLKEEPCSRLKRGTMLRDCSECGSSAPPWRGNVLKTQERNCTREHSDCYCSPPPKKWPPKKWSHTTLCNLLYVDAGICLHLHITWKTFILIAVYYYFQVKFYLLRNLGQIVSPGQIKLIANESLLKFCKLCCWIEYSQYWSVLQLKFVKF